MRTRFTPGAGLALISLMLLLAGGRQAADAHTDGPFVAVLSPDDTRLYVINTLVPGLQTIDTATNRLIASIPLEGGQYMYGVAVSGDGARLYVPYGYLGAVGVIDTATDKVIATVPVGRWPIGVVVSPDGKRVYVTNSGEGTVSVIDSDTLQVVGTVGVGGSPQWSAVSPDGKRLYVSVDDSSILDGDPLLNGIVAVIDTQALQETAAIAVGPYPGGITTSPDDERVYLTIFSNQVDVIGPYANRVVATITGTPADQFAAVAVSPDGKRLYVGSSDGPKIAVIDTGTDQIVGGVKVTGDVESLAISSDGKRLYAPSLSSNTVAVIDTTALDVVTVVKLGDAVTPG